MKHILTATCLAVAVAATAGAQSYPEKKQPEPRSSEKTAQSVTIAGCVKEGDTPNSFYLANVDANAVAAHHGTGATGTSGMPPAPAGSSATAPNTTTVQLISTGDIDFKQHVGHKVEVSGTISPAKSEPPSGGAAGTSGTPSSDTTSRERADKSKDKTLAHAHKINVRSVKMISETCSM